MQEVITLATDTRETLVDITGPVKAVVARSGIRDGLVSVYVRGATAAVMIQENWDESVQTLSLIHISEPTRLLRRSRMPSSA